MPLDEKSCTIPENQNDLISRCQTVRGDEVINRDDLIDEILMLQREWIVGPRAQKVSNGFLISQFDADELRSLIKENGLLHYIRNEEGLLGYVLITKIEEFTSLYTDPSQGVFRSDLLIQIGSGCEYLYQIAVRKNTERKGIGKQLLEYALAKTKSSLLTDVLIQPISNEASCTFFRKNGFEDAGTLILSSYRDFGSLTSKVFLCRR